MKEGQRYCVALFNSVSHVMKAEKVLNEAGINHKIIPVPRAISVDCGVCVRFLPDQRDAIIEALRTQVAVKEIREL
jgi:hypothetical protein